ncbi:protein phosphatase 5 [Phaffia rhodozyma]|uniref:Serine/threonine-protein phosphatase n=1 Tax=Phaffia rhodozyma TaxID=264483 RepID=A0A0F7SFV5_PHARH|nr:protein phosphatase 5 [Phaffia rhodozyma]
MQPSSDTDSSSVCLDNSSAPTSFESAWVMPPMSDDITPFNSPRIMANLSLNGDDKEVDDFKLVTDEDRAEALRIKGEANKAFAAKDFKKAIQLYGDAITLNPKDPIFWSNRAFAKMKLEEFGGAVSDATKAIEIDPKAVKAYYRRALSQLAVLHPKPAVADLKEVLKLEPSNIEARKQLEATQKLMHRIAFEKAISAGDTESASHRSRRMINDGSCPMDAKYTGPLPQPPSESEGENGRWKPTKEFVEGMIEWFREGKGHLPKRLVWEIVLGCEEVLRKEKTLVEIDIEEDCTVDVIGDTHGQFYDLLHLFTLTGPPSPNHILLFNGDFVDRGSWSVEVALTLFAYKWLYPNRIYLNRGNHETADMNKVYGFEGEVKHKHGEPTYKLFSDVFTALPLATLLSPTRSPRTLSSLSLSRDPPKAFLSPEGRKRFFVVHGGLFSKDGVTLDDIRKIDRFGRQPGQEGLMMELLWTDPQEAEGRGPSKRGVGVGFGPDVTKTWCEANGVTAVFRSHEVRQAGYSVEHDGLCVTVFSAPNYCDSTGNKGAFIRVDAEGEVKYTSFNSVSHPPMRPMAYSQGFNGLM